MIAVFFYRDIYLRDLGLNLYFYVLRSKIYFNYL